MFSRKKSGISDEEYRKQNVLKPIDFVVTLLEGKVKYQKLPSGNSEYIEFYDKNGEMQKEGFRWLAGKHLERWTIYRAVLMPKHSRK